MLKNLKKNARQEILIKEGRIILSANEEAKGNEEHTGWFFFQIREQKGTRKIGRQRVRYSRTAAAV